MAEMPSAFCVLIPARPSQKTADCADSSDEEESQSRSDGACFLTGVGYATVSASSAIQDVTEADLSFLLI